MKVPAPDPNGPPSPLLGERAGGEGALPVPVYWIKVARRLREACRPLLLHHGFDLRPGSGAGLRKALEAGETPLVLLGAEADPLQAGAGCGGQPYTILLGEGEPHLRQRCLQAEIQAWIPTPDPDQVYLACRTGLAWSHLWREVSSARARLEELQQNRSLLEQETDLLRSQALTDPLTELLNRRAFTQHLEHALHQWERHRRPFTLILGDLDYFKLINDRFGHLVGDQVLRAVAQRIRSTLRRADLAFRIGGEEFAILLTETPLSAGADVADKIRRRIDESPVPLDTGQTVLPTMSFGVGSPEETEVTTLFHRVDQALYAAKRKGRNRIEIVRGPRGRSEAPRAGA
jgi:diguanylate cyclase (GGDEF)-like protein